MKTARNRRGCINNPDLAYQAEPREVKLRKIISGESSNMEDGVFPTIYTEKKDGVQPEFDIRTDRFEVAIDEHFDENRLMAMSSIIQFLTNCTTEQLETIEAEFERSKNNHDNNNIQRQRTTFNRVRKSKESTLYSFALRWQTVY